MTRRLFWLVMGMTIGGVTVHKVSAAMQKLTPRGIAKYVGGRLITKLRDTSRLRDTSGLPGARLPGAIRLRSGAAKKRA